MQKRCTITYLRSGASRSIRGPWFKSKQAVILCFEGDGVYGGAPVSVRQICFKYDPTLMLKTQDQRTRFNVKIQRSENDLEIWGSVVGLLLPHEEHDGAGDGGFTGASKLPRKWQVGIWFCSEFCVDHESTLGFLNRCLSCEKQRRKVWMKNW
jgi:hypothetical protein